MAILFDSIKIPNGWSRAYFGQLATYVRDCSADGCYYGNKEQYEKRAKEILEWVEEIEDTLYAEDSNYVFSRRNDK